MTVEKMKGGKVGGGSDEEREKIKGKLGQKEEEEEEKVERQAKGI